MNDIWKGIALFAIWGGFAAVMIAIAISKTHANLLGYAVAAVIATIFIVF